MALNWDRLLYESGMPAFLVELFPWTLKPGVWVCSQQFRALGLQRTGILAAYNSHVQPRTMLLFAASLVGVPWSDRISLLSTAEFSLEQDTF
jgi:hypothetical protein